MNFEAIKLIGVNIKDYLVDLALLVIVGLTINPVLDLLNKQLHVLLSSLGINDSYDILPLPLDLIKISVWIISFLIIRWIMGKRITTLLSGIFKNEYSFYADIEDNQLTEGRLIKEWIIQGNVFVDDKGLLISNSNSGCLIKPRLIINRIWKDFTAEIEIEFTPQLRVINNCSCFNPILGILFRAQSFDDYFMLEINYINKHIVIRPHVRVGGNFDAPELNPDFDSYPLGLGVYMRFKGKLVVKGSKVIFYVNGDNEKPLIWILPDFVEPRLKQHTGGGVKDGSKTVVAEIYFKNWAGMFGFRNYPNELALIKSLDVYP